MSDLVKRLRTYHREVVELDDGECPATAMVREAADEIDWLRSVADAEMRLREGTFEQIEALAADNERLTRRLEGATRLLNAWHFEYHYGRRLEGIDDDTTTWLGGIDVPDRAADQPEPQDESHESPNPKG